MEKLPKPVRSLEPYQAEDFLCIFKDQFSGAGGQGEGVWAEEFKRLIAHNVRVLKFSIHFGPPLAHSPS
jgi:hypothetical protein